MPTWKGEIEPGTHYTIVKVKVDRSGHQEELTEVGRLLIRPSGESGYLVLDMFDGEYGLFRKSCTRPSGQIRLPAL